MKFDVVSKEEADKMGRGIRMKPEERAAIEGALKQLQNANGQLLKVEVLPTEKPTVVRTKMRKVASTMGIDRLLFRKAGDTHLLCWVATEQEWQEWNDRPKVGRQPEAAPAPPRKKK